MMMMIMSDKALTVVMMELSFKALAITLTPLTWILFPACKSINMLPNMDR